MSWVLMDLGYTWGYTFGGKEHGLVGNGHTNFLPMQSVSRDKGEGGGGYKINRFGGFFNIIHSMVSLWIRILASLIT